MITAPFSGALFYNKTTRKLEQEDDNWFITDSSDEVIKMQVDVVEVQVAGPPRKTIDNAFLDLQAAHPGQHCIMRYEILWSPLGPEAPTTRILYAYEIGA